MESRLDFKAKFFGFLPYFCILFILCSNSNLAPKGRNVGFYCNDTSIKYPYHGDSINTSLLFTSLLGGSSLIIYISQCLCNTFQGGAPTKLWNYVFKHHVKHFHKGFLYVLVVTEFLKNMHPELRPHFFYTCMPDVDINKCSNGLVTNYSCTGAGPNWLIYRDIYKSFPSGHASLSFYTFIFLSIFVNKKQLTSSKLSLFWKIFVPLLFVTWSSICSASRHLDNRHHWWDIAVGLAIGLLGGLLNAGFSLEDEILKDRKYS